MSTLREKIFERKGEGILKPRNTDSSIEIPVKFTCEQYRDGDIKGTIELVERDHTPYQNFFFFPVNDLKKFSLNANVDGEELNIASLIISNISYRVTNNFEFRDITFVTNYLKLKCRAISSISNKVRCRFNVANLKSISTHFEIEEGEITFSSYPNDIWNDIKIYKRSGITCGIGIELNGTVRYNSINDYKSLFLKQIEKILLLASLSQGTYIDWASFELFEQTNEGNYERVYSERKTIRSSFSSLHELTPHGDLSNYYKRTYPNYVQNLDTNLGFKFAVAWYLESLKDTVLQSKYLLACVCLELLKDRYNKMIGNEYIFPKDRFDNEIYQDLKEKTKEVLIEKGLNEDTTEHKNSRGEIYANLKGINRTSFRSSLLRLLNDLHIVYNDLFSDLNVITKIRNQITHQGLQETEHEELFKIYQCVICLIQRIFLALLKYDGVFLNKNDPNELIKKFTDFINGDFATIPEEGDNERTE